MYCQKCGQQNPDNAKVCHSCDVALSAAPDATKYPVPKISVLAILALAFGIMSFFTFGLTIIPAIILGVISIIIVEKSGGRVTGKGFAIMGIVIAMLVFLINFVPLFRKVKRTEFLIVCGTNLAGIGKAMQVYGNDYDGVYPRSGGKYSGWTPISGGKHSVYTGHIWTGHIPNWKADNQFSAYGLKPDGTCGQVSISSCFYLLVKYAGVPPESFICQGDKRATEFIPSDEGAGNMKLVDLWDFGPEPSKHCSYSYHMPFGLYTLTKSSDPGMAVAADRNPWIDSPGAKAKKWPFFVNTFHITKEEARFLNAITHQEDGQNVLFVDGHVSFEKKPFCGVDDDNIYTFWFGGDIRIGGCPWVTSTSQRGSEPQDELDSLLVHDGP